VAGAADLAAPGAPLASPVDASSTVGVSLEEAEDALRAKAAATSNPAYGRRLSKFLRLLDWARS
jgi:hypothetical protein